MTRSLCFYTSFSNRITSCSSFRSEKKNVVVAIRQAYSSLQFTVAARYGVSAKRERTRTQPATESNRSVIKVCKTDFQNDSIESRATFTLSKQRTKTHLTRKMTGAPNEKKIKHGKNVKIKEQNTEKKAAEEIQSNIFIAYIAILLLFLCNSSTHFTHTHSLTRFLSFIYMAVSVHRMWQWIKKRREWHSFDIYGFFLSALSFIRSLLFSLSGWRSAIQFAHWRIDDAELCIKAIKRFQSKQLSLRKYFTSIWLNPLFLPNLRFFSDRRCRRQFRIKTMQK